jgi:tyrosyl-tRNA synthetase
VGREIQKAYGMAPQTVMTLPLLEGTDGIQKMSKSLGNYVGVTEAPDEIFGKVMSVSDQLMLRWYDVLEADVAGEVRGDLDAGRIHPREAKARLAALQVERFYSAAAAQAARVRFDERFRGGAVADDLIPEEHVRGPLPPEISLPALLAESGLAKSRSDARRLLQQGAVRINGRQVLTERFLTQQVPECGSQRPQLLIEVGKRRIRRFCYGG